MLLVDRALFNYTANKPARLIKRNGVPYLERYFVGQVRGFNFYLHRFVAPDMIEDVHNHPWGFALALVLSGGYLETVATDICPFVDDRSGCITKTRRIRWWNYIPGHHFHSISKPKPGTWTFFIHGPRQLLPDGKEKAWGFLERFVAVVEPLHILTIFSPHESRGREDWWVDSPLGKDSGREPLC